MHQANPSFEPPMDANTSDWHEQWQEVSDADSDDRDEYRSSDFTGFAAHGWFRGARPVRARHVTWRLAALDCPRAQEKSQTA
jgi:hypothetical protein